MTRKEFVSMVIEEINHLKENATSEEINKLDFDEFNYCDSFQCIYGQMTGACDSNRAEELYSKKYRSIEKPHEIYRDSYPFKTHSFRKGKYFTPLEKYLYMVDAKVHKHIINYLKDEDKELNIK